MRNLKLQLLMARYEHLPIYKKATALTIYCEKIVRSFSGYHKYTLGSESRGRSRGIVVPSYDGNVWFLGGP